MQGTGEYYLISHLVLLTGLTDRTIRNHITSGVLKGEKINGIWHFSPDPVERFLRHPFVRQSLAARRQAVVSDYLMDDRKKS